MRKNANPAESIALRALHPVEVASGILITLGSVIAVLAFVGELTGWYSGIVPERE